MAHKELPKYGRYIEMIQRKNTLLAPCIILKRWTPIVTVGLLAALPLVTILNPSCWATENPPSSFRLDPTLLRSWEPKAKLPCAAPFKAIYRKNGKEVTFLAVNHIKNPVTPSNSELSLIGQEIERIRPSGMVVELKSSGIPLPKEELDTYYPDCMKDGKFTCGEPSYAALIGGKVFSSVLGGEPGSKKLNSALEGKLSQEDQLAFESIKIVNSMKQDGIKADKWPDHFSSEFKLNPAFSQSDWSYAKFRAWLKANMNSEISSASARWMEPRSDAKASKLQKIAEEIEKTREPMVQSAIQSQINKFDTTMVVYGSGHYYKQAPALEKVFGPPEIKCLYPAPKEATHLSPTGIGNVAR